MIRSYYKFDTTKSNILFPPQKKKTFLKYPTHKISGDKL